MTDSAIPENEGVVGFDHREGVVAVSWYSHFEIVTDLVEGDMWGEDECERMDV